MHAYYYILIKPKAPPWITVSNGDLLSSSFDVLAQCYILSGMQQKTLILHNNK